MPVVDTANLGALTGSEKHQIYCGIDTCIMPEILDEMNDLPCRRRAESTYLFERQLQAPYLDMMMRGFRVNLAARDRALTALIARRDSLQEKLDYLARALWDKGLNPRSQPQLQEFFYNVMNIPQVWIWQKGEKKLSMNREALEKIEEYLFARPFVSLILSIRDIAKDSEVLETQIDSDGRMRTSYQIARTVSGRASSEKSATGSGRNMQNIQGNLRYIFIADVGKKLGHVDEEQVEARDVGWFCGTKIGDWSLLNACECLTDEHEVLTKEGWISIAEKPDEILTWSHWELRYEKVLRWNEGYTNKIVHAVNRSIEVSGTSNHGMPVFTGGRSNILKKKSLGDIANAPNYKAPLTGVIENKHGVEEKNAAIIAAFQADGTRDSKGKVHWTFTKQRKIDNMRGILCALGFEYSEYTLGSGNTRFYLLSDQGQDKWPKVCGREILSWNKKSIQAFCESHLLWDASITEDNYSIVNKDKSHLDWLATAYMLYGKATSIRKHKERYWELTIKNSRNTQYRSCKIHTTESSSPIFRVFCPTTEAGFFMVRRNGKIFISGNSGDFHTSNARLIWPERPWTGDLKKDRKLAEEKFYRDMSYRDMSKRGGHLSNYMGTAHTASRHLKVPLEVMENFQKRYIFGGPGITPAFPCIEKWWGVEIRELETTMKHTNPFGRERQFFGRVTSPEVHREAIADLPQGTTADRTNRWLLNSWRGCPDIQVLAQTHDSFTFQYDDRGPEYEGEIMKYVLEELRKVELRDGKSGRRYSVPGEAKVGWNWGNENKGNPLGLRKWSPNMRDDRERPSVHFVK